MSTNDIPAGAVNAAAPAGRPWEAGTLPTEQVGSLPRPAALQAAVLDLEIGVLARDEFARIQDAAVRDTLDRLIATGSPIVSDGEQRRQSFASYPLGADDLDEGPVFAVFADGHHRVVPSISAPPFRFQGWAADDVSAIRPLTDLPLKQAVISPSMLSLMVHAEQAGSSVRAELIEDIVAGCAKDIQRCFAAGASRVSIDFTEGRLALRQDLRAPWAGPAALGGFIELINAVLDRLTSEQRGDGRPHLSRKRERLCAQRRHRLCRAHSRAVSDRGGVFPHAGGERERSGSRCAPRRSRTHRARRGRATAAARAARRHRPDESAP
ncbi:MULTISPECIES: hypothetical protein [unclassified Leucobacter]|uniref:hypothetical protein n=1 Tax=unclassified Leucobacter TaxID=2621730 RepID=UPI00203E5721|nr:MULTISPECIES: hypothetical protein [unclassified Leucobacter]